MRVSKSSFITFLVILLAAFIMWMYLLFNYNPYKITKQYIEPVVNSEIAQPEIQYIYVTPEFSTVDIAEANKEPQH